MSSGHDQLSDDAAHEPRKLGYPEKFIAGLRGEHQHSRETGLPSTTRLVLWTVSKFMDGDGTGAHPGLEREALRPAAIDRILDMAEAMMREERARAAQPGKLQAELRNAERERDNLLELAGSGRAPRSVLERIGALDTAIEGLRQRIAHANVAEPSELDRARWRKAMRERLPELERLLQADVPMARQALRKMLDGPITFDGSSGTYVLKGRTRLGALVDIGVVPRKGLEPPQCCHR